MTTEDILSLLLGLAVLLPLISFGAIAVFGPRMGKAGEYGGYVATGAIVGAFALSVIALAVWVGDTGAGGQNGSALEAEHVTGSATPAAGVVRGQDTENADSDEHHAGHDADHGQHDGHEEAGPPKYYAGDWYTLGQFGRLRLTIGYFIDSLTIVMFCMVTLIASCIHFYAFGYMHEELEDVTDHEITVSDGSHLRRPGRFPRFFQYMSLFCFSMLGLVVSGNIAMTFVFWELVGICSYFLIGFYVERKSACNAANKAFIVNRIGDFGMIIGLMVLWSSLGTLSFGDVDVDGDGTKADTQEVTEIGIFSQVGGPISDSEGRFRLPAPDGMVRLAAGNEIAEIVGAFPRGTPRDEIESAIAARVPEWRDGGPSGDGPRYGYGLLIVAGLGIFCGCVGKSAQFPLHTWLPDAMEGPTPVSALVHSATMVAAGVFLVGRFYPVFAPEVLLVIAVVGCITLFMAATIAITATDIKRVLAYSTVSQLGYMMFSLGVGGWLAGMLHLITHAFFKSLLFLCSGSVIHAVHSNEMTEMGGLRKKMPWTAYTMLVGCLAIIGAGIPFVIGLSGYYSKDAILAQGLVFSNQNPGWGFLFLVAAGGAAITAFYMFRLWFMTFAGVPRNADRYEHAHESPKVMWVPLVILATFAVVVVWPTFKLSPLVHLLEAAAPVSVHGGLAAEQLAIPAEHLSHAEDVHVKATGIAFGTALAGLLMATMFYGLRYLNPADASTQFAPIHRFLLNKWWFDELYDMMFVRPTLIVSRVAAGFDKRWIDGLVDGTARLVCRFSNAWDYVIDRIMVDGLANLIARWTYSVGLSMRRVQTGKLRQYVLFIVVGVFILWAVYWRFSTGVTAGG